jgi:hypothetical protein
LDKWLFEGGTNVGEAVLPIAVGVVLLALFVWERWRHH